jgi:hypothetical protein
METAYKIFGVVVTAFVAYFLFALSVKMTALVLSIQDFPFLPFF